MKKLIHILLLVILIGISFSALALNGESIVFNPATGNYLITYLDSNDNSLHQVTFIPSTKINPTIRMKFRLEQGEVIHYGYTLTSGRDSQQDITLIILDPVSSVTTVPDIPLNAQANQTAIDMLNQEGAAAINRVINIVTQTATDMDNVAKHFDTPALWDASLNYSRGQNAFRIGWDAKVTNGMHPGGQATFGINSRDLPSIIQAKIHGYAPGSKKLPGEQTQDANDGGFGQQYTALVTQNYFVPRNAAVPTIAVPSPFEAAVLLDRIQTQMHTWIGMSLLDSAFSAQLDRYFQSAISAYRLNQSEVGKKQIQTMLELIKKEQPNAGNGEGDNEGDSQNKNKPALIDPLATHVLDFDLQYVMKRAGESDGEHASTSTSKPVPSPSKPQHER
jgi:hypothetical protein